MPILLLTISAVLTLAGFLSRGGWVFDLASHFRVQYCAVQILCVLLCLLLKKKRLLWLTLVFLALNLSEILPLYCTAPVGNTPNIGNIKVLIINVHSQNRQYKKVADYIKRIDPDILALEEINARWHEQLAGTLKDFPHHRFELREDNFGIGLFSKLPGRMAIQYYGEVQVPSVLARISVNNKPVDVLFTHPVPPASRDYFGWRNQQLSEITLSRSRFSENLIVIGDLNTTSWSYYFKDFLKRMGLRDSRRGYGLQVSWPAMFKVLGITIDHCLVSPRVQVLARRVGPDVGSDHYPVYVRLGL